MFSLDQYRALRAGAGLLERSARGRLLLTGADRRAYLQGLLTNDIVALTPGTGCYAAYLTSQGRMIADVRAFELGDALLADMEGEVLPTVRDRWAQFIFAEDVEIKDLSSTTAQLGIYGPGAAAVLAAALANDRDASLPAPGAEELQGMALLASTQCGIGGGTAFILRSDDVGVAGFDVVVPIELRGSLASALTAAGAVAVDADAAEAVRVESGRPLFNVDMDEGTIPLEAGIEDRAISLTKGCYVGQEIIIRVLHRGHGRVARRLVGLSFDPASPVPEKGAKVQAGDREVGVITSAVRSPALEKPIALGYVHRDFVEPGTALTVGASAATVTRTPFV